MKDGVSDHLTAPVDAAAEHSASSATVDLPDRWRLLELLGAGGQATVWLAEDRTLGQRVALKILPADADERTRARWLEEVRQGRRLSHPNLIRIYDVVETSDRPVAVMEYVIGGTLADRVATDGAQPIEAVIGWAREVLSVLAYLHENRIVHRDVKPSNLLVGEDGAVKLSDLGLVRHLDRSSDLTRTLEGVGTPRFMAPEQLRGEVPTASCDLYSLGVTLFQLLTGRLPFEGDSAFQVADGHLHADPPPIRDFRPDCPRWLARFVERLLEKDQRARYSSADAAANALDRRRIGMSRRIWRRLAAGLGVARRPRSRSRSGRPAGFRPSTGWRPPDRRCSPATAKDAACGRTSGPGSCPRPSWPILSAARTTRWRWAGRCTAGTAHRGKE